MDRIDLHIEVDSVEYDDLKKQKEKKSILQLLNKELILQELCKMRGLKLAKCTTMRQ